MGAIISRLFSKKYNDSNCLLALHKSSSGTIIFPESGIHIDVYDENIQNAIDNESIHV
jgi:hypothetical protein